jgi:membrane-bound ClpP family serine protease
VNTWPADNIPIVCLFAALMLALSAPASNTVAQSAASQPIVRVDIKGAIGVGTAYHLNEAFATAREQDAQLIVIQIDTPGGLVSATSDIIKVILGSPIPIAVYVAPSGARAASAGTYITYAAHIAAMTPGTHLGAATPIEIGARALPGRPGPSPDDPSKPSDDDKDNPSRKKSVNDAVSYLKSLAQLRGRNAVWAVILGIGGVNAFMLGSLILFDPAGADIDFSVAWPVALSATLTSALLIMGLLGFIFRAPRRKIRTGAEELIGLEGRVVSWKTEEGRLRIHGEIWSARSSHQLKPGQAMSVGQRQGLTLIVSPIKERTQPCSPSICSPCCCRSS